MLSLTIYRQQWISMGGWFSKASTMANFTSQAARFSSFCFVHIFLRFKPLGATKPIGKKASRSLPFKNVNLDLLPLHVTRAKAQPVLV